MYLNITFISINLLHIKKTIKFALSLRRRHIQMSGNTQLISQLCYVEIPYMEGRLSRALFTDSLKAQETLKLQSRNMATIDATGYDTIVCPYCILQLCMSFSTLAYFYFYLHIRLADMFISAWGLGLLVSTTMGNSQGLKLWSE